ncbi:MAG: MFS transporter [Bacteroidetes bacterium]|nr:MFS transporter [Bacteroidota bacterium]
MSKKEDRKLHPGAWVPTLYLSEGLPFAAVTVASVLMYKNMGLSDTQIAFFTTLIAWPWTLKPLWSPFIEMFKTKKHFVVGTQFIGGLLFGLLALLLPFDGWLQYSLALFGIIAFNFATHDIAADGVYINVLSGSEQSKYIGFQGAFYNVGKILSQGALVYVAGQFEESLGVTPAWMIVMGIFGAIMIVMSLYHYKMLPSGGVAKGEVKSVKEAFVTFADVVKTFFEKKNIWWGLAFIIFYRFAEGQAIKIAPLFLRTARELGGLGMTTSEIGIAYGTFGSAAFVLGSIAAGYFVSKRGLRKSLFLLCCFFNVPFVVYLVLSLTMPTNFYLISSAIVCEYFGYGFGFVGLTLFMMQQIAPGKYQMAHYAFGTAVMFLGFMIPSMFSGYISDAIGYQNFFIWVMIATIPSFLVSWFVPFDNPEPTGIEAT